MASIARMLAARRLGEAFGRTGRDWREGLDEYDGEVAERPPGPTCSGCDSCALPGGRMYGDGRVAWCREYGEFVYADAPADECGGVMGMDYGEFLASKRAQAPSGGFEVAEGEVSGALFGFQRDIVRWACRKGKAAVFADCGMGKTAIQLEWARLACERAGGGTALVVAPLAVSAQTRREGEKFGVPVRAVRSASEMAPGVNVTNYEMLHAFEGAAVDAVVLDESSILKSYAGKVRNQVIAMFRDVPMRLACTATPAPNDYMELGNHSEFLGVMDRPEMLAMFFVHDGGDTSKWRLKGHAAPRFWDWVGTWACMVTRPSDLGYPDGAFELPEMTVETHVVASAAEPGEMFPKMAQTLGEQRRARRESMAERVAVVAGMVNASDEPWLVWCDLNAESEALARAMPDAVEVRGSDSAESKEDAMIGFADGRYRVLVTKPSIAGFGMNWQHCSHMAFCGLSHSYEQFYQAVRRCWRFGQARPVDVHVVVSEKEAAVVGNVTRKREESGEMAREMVARAARVRDGSGPTGRDESPYEVADASGEGWAMMLGDCVERIREIPGESVHLSVFSPPFASLYTYSNSDRDMGNCSGAGEFERHFAFLADELFRVTMPGREVSFHCMSLPLSKERDGVIGLRDFRGELIRVFERAGFVFHSEVTIWKDPVTAMQRTKAIGLLNKQKNKDSALSRQGIPDYLVTMRKPGENPEPVTHTDDDFPISAWQRIASPVWMDINPSDTLQYREARESDDERHICPLQLEVIERAVKLWSNPGDTVLSPFAGIGSEGYVAVKQGRRFIGIELKRSYFELACRNLAVAEEEAGQRSMLDFLEVGA